MKTKGKKADKLDKKKPAPSKTDAKAHVNETRDTNAVALAVAEETIVVAPIEAPSHGPSVTAAAAVAPRRAISSEERQRLIALAAYYRAQKAGFGRTNPVDDWLMAEREVDAMMTTGDAL